MAKWFMSGR